MINMQYYPTLYSGFIPTSITGWGDLSNIIANPSMKYRHKDDVPLWSFYITVPDENLSRNDRNEPRGCSENVRMLTALQLDYDNGVTINEFIDKFKDFEFYLYTTFRHAENDHRFRIVMPLDAIYGNNLLSCPKNKELLLSFFTGCDTSTINSFRKQKVPACNPNGGVYVHHTNNGKRFELPWKEMLKNYNDYNIPYIPLTTYDESYDMDDWYYEIEGLYVPKRIDVKEATRKSCENLLGALPWGNNGTGVIHATITSVYGKLRKSGHESQEAIDIIIGYATKERVQEIRNLARLK